MVPLFLDNVPCAAPKRSTCECPCCHYRWKIPDPQRDFTLRCTNCGAVLIFADDRLISVAVVAR